MGLRAGLEQLAAEWQQFFAASIGEETGKPDAHKPARQYVQHEATEELFGGHCHLAMLATMGVVLVTEGNLAVDKGQESVIGDGNSVRVAGQVLKHMLRPSEGAFGIDHPVLAEEWSKECVEAFSLASGWRLPGKTSLP